MVGGTVKKIMWVGRAKKVLLAFGLLVVMVSLVFGLLLFLATKPADAATTFTVNKTGDAQDRNIIDAKCDTSRKRGNQCTLRAAIQESNDTLGADLITFNIGGTSSVKTINVGSTGLGELPAITEAVTINGYTQQGAKANTKAVGNDAVLKVQLNGTNAGASASGLTINASDSTIKGLVINRFGGAGFEVWSSGVLGNNKVEGNFIGTNASGTQALGNFIGVHILRSTNTIGGTKPAKRNVISGNTLVGVLIEFGSATGNKVKGNYIGTNKGGTQALGNNGNGVSISFASNNTIGGTTAAARNVISANEQEGVSIEGVGATNNFVQGNYIGTDKTGTANLGNGYNGVLIADRASNNTVGGASSGTANTIAFNGSGFQDGVRIGGAPGGTGNRILSNSIFSNTNLGIDLGDNGVTPNDTGDGDTGANNLQNFPLITSATAALMGTVTDITGTLNSNPSQTYTIQCFTTEAGGDPSSHGEGQSLVASTTTTTAANGEATFTCSVPRSLAGQKVSATATNTTTGDTSEFSASVTVTNGP